MPVRDGRFLITLQQKASHWFDGTRPSSQTSGLPLRHAAPGSLSQQLRQSVLLIKNKVASGATADDADTLARYAMLVPNTIAYGDFVTAAMA